MAETVNTGAILISDGNGGYSKLFTESMTDIVKLQNGSSLTEKLAEIDGKLPIVLTSGQLPETLGIGKVAFACDTSGNMKILAGKIDESVVEILTSESGVLRYEEVSGETVNPFTVDADTLGGSTKEEIISEAQSGVDLSAYATAENLSSHTGNTNNPHGVTKAQVGLGNVDNTADSQKSVNYANSAGSAGSANTAGTASNAHSAANPDPGTASLKNIQAGTGDIGVGAGLATGTIYLVYE